MSTHTFDSGGYFAAQSIRFTRNPWIAEVEATLSSGASTQITLFCTSDLERVIELIRGVDTFTITDKGGTNPNVEVGRYQVTMTRDDAIFVFSCDRWESLTIPAEPGARANELHCQ